MQPQKPIRGETGVSFKLFKRRSEVNWNLSQSRVANSKVVMLIHKQPFAKYLHYNELKHYRRRLLRQIRASAIIIKQLRMSE